jgi:hypothetical protein
MQTPGQANDQRDMAILANKKKVWPGINVMITISGGFDQFLAKNIRRFLNFLHVIAVFRAKIENLIRFRWLK